MADICKQLRSELTSPEFSEGYAESFQDTYIATQIKVLREQNGWTQATLAKKLETTQTAISRVENVNYSSWNIGTLKKLARAFRVRLKVSFETYGSLVDDVGGFSRASLQRIPREKDPELEPAFSNHLKNGKLLVMPSQLCDDDEQKLPQVDRDVPPSTPHGAGMDKPFADMATGDTAIPFTKAPPIEDQIPMKKIAHGIHAEAQVVHHGR